MRRLAMGVSAFVVAFVALYVMLRLIGDAKPLAVALKYAIIGTGVHWTLDYSRRQVKERSQK